jgi:hypothetical protein
MTEPEMPDGFWEWLAEQDPEEVPFRAHVSDTALAQLMDHARNHTSKDRSISLAELMERWER